MLVQTPASTKVYKAKNDGEPAVQLFNAVVGDGALLVFAPDPVVPFADAIYHQRQSLRLSPDASVVIVESVNSGRATRGERWQFEEYSTETTFSMARVGQPALAPAADTPSPNDDGCGGDGDSSGVGDTWFTDKTTLDSGGRGGTNWGFDMGGVPRDAFASVGAGLTTSKPCVCWLPTKHLQLQPASHRS